MSRKVLVIGGSGQVGRAVVAAFDGDEVFDARRTPQTDDQLKVDLTDSASITSALEATQPDVVVIAAAWTWVDGAEDKPEVCRATNVDGPAQVARWCAEHDATIVYYSSDHVFDGSNNPHPVDDAVNPLNVYAASKVEGEAAMRELAPKHLILRTAWVYGPDVREMNFAIRLVRAVQGGGSVKVPQDQWGTPTWAPDLAQVTRELIDRGLTGTYQVVGPDFVSRLDLSQRVCRAFGLDDASLEAIDTADLNQRAKRPLKVSMDTSDIDAVLSNAVRGVDAGLEALAAWDAERSNG